MNSDINLSAALHQTVVLPESASISRVCIPTAYLEVREDSVVIENVSERLVQRKVDAENFYRYEWRTFDAVFGTGLNEESEDCNAEKSFNCWFGRFLGFINILQSCAFRKVCKQHIKRRLCGLHA